jgi:serine/threonine protein kinase/Tfp pilus assembly protein PilF
MNAVHVSQTSSREDQQLVELVEEITARLQAGQSCDIDEYAARFPEYADRLRDWMTVMSAMADLGHSLAVGATSRAALSSPASPRTDDTAGLSTRDEADGHVTGVLGDFRILHEIGRGGMGVVYEAEQISIGRRVALKVLPFAAMLDKQQLNRFKNEARAAGTLDHPNIVAIHSVGTERGVHYYAMQLIEGQSLAQVVEQLRSKSGSGVEQKRSSDVDQQSIDYSTTPLLHYSSSVHPASSIQHQADTEPVARLSTLPDVDSREYFRAIAHLGIQAAEALDHAHQNGILHRDIKPANLLVDDTGKLWITDFGLARMDQDAGMTMTGDLLGTLRYMSPEQALAQRVLVDHRSDIYSLGVTLYELMTLRPAYAATDRRELLRQIAFEDPRKPQQINSRIPQDLETIVLKAIEKNPADRYATAQELADDLRRFREYQTIKAKRPNLPQSILKWSRRNQRLVAGVTLAMALLVLVSTFSAFQIWREKAQTEAALEQAKVERTRAENSAAESKALVTFLVDDLFGSANPEKAMGEKVTVEEVLEQAESKVESALKDQPLLEASIRQALGKVHNSLGNGEQAEKQLRRARELQERLLGSDPETLETLTELADSLFEQQRLVEARQLYELTLDRRRRLLGPRHADTLDSMRNVGMTYSQQGRFDRGEELLEKVFAEMRSILGPEAKQTLLAQHDLAATLFFRGQYDRARRLLEEAAITATRTLGDAHPYTFKHKQTLAYAYRHFLSSNDDARRIYDEILVTQRRVYGPLHPSTIQTLDGIVDILIEERQYDAAVRQYEPTYEQLRSELGPQHVLTLGATLRMARLLAGQGKKEQAQEHLTNAESALENRRRELGPEDWGTINFMAKLAEFHKEQGQLDDALAIRKQRLEILRRLAGLENPLARGHMLHEMHDVAFLFREVGQLNDSRQLFEEALALKRQVFGEENLATLTSLHELAGVIFRQGDSSTSEKMYRELITLRRRVVGPEHRETLAAIHELATVLGDQGKFEEAIKLRKEALDGLRRVLGPTHPDTLLCMGELAMTHRNFGQYNEAIELLRERLELQRRVLRPKHPDIVLTAHHLANILGKQDWKGAVAEIAELNKTAFDIALATYGQEHPDTLKMMSNYSESLKNLGQYEEACRLSRQAVDISRRVQGAEHRDTLIITRVLGSILREQGNYEEARPLLEKTIEIQRRTLGTDHPDTLKTMRCLADLLIKQGHRREAYELVHLAGTLHYRARRWSDAAEEFNVALEHADEAASKAASSFYLAMANFQAGERDKAQSIRAQASEAMIGAAENEELARLRDEATALLEISETPITIKTE